jgi:hypothetical protein
MARADPFQSCLQLDPLYVDVIVRRYEAATGEDAILAVTGETFSDLAEQRERG